MKVFINKKLFNAEDAKISVFDTGFLYGDGVFEGIRAYGGRVFRLKEHLDRLWSSAKAINLEISLDKRDIERAIMKTLLANKLSDAYIRITITRGEHDFISKSEHCTFSPCVIIMTYKTPTYPKEIYEKGIEVTTSSTRRTTQDSLSPNIKSLSCLNNILAIDNANRCGFIDALMLNSQGYVAGCSMDNIFIVKNDVLLTPTPSEGAFMGVTRDVVMELAKNKLKMSVKQERIALYDVYNADECFSTSTVSEITPIVIVDSRRILDGKPGKITLELIKEFKNLTRLTGTPIK